MRIDLWDSQILEQLRTLHMFAEDFESSFDLWKDLWETWYHSLTAVVLWVYPSLLQSQDSIHYNIVYMN